jgi:hypothetical protein
LPPPTPRLRARDLATRGAAQGGQQGAGENDTKCIPQPPTCEHASPYHGLRFSSKTI